MKNFLLCSIVFMVIFISGCSSSEQRVVKKLGENDCQQLVESKNEILADYAGYHTATIMNINNTDFSSLSQEKLLDLNEKIIVDLTKKAEELTEEYINSLYLSENETEFFGSKYSKISSKTKNLGNKSIEAPNFCSNEQSYEIKNLDDIYIKFYWCFVNYEMNEDYGFNLIECSTNLTESYYGYIINTYDSYNGK